MERGEWKGNSGPWIIFLVCLLVGWCARSSGSSRCELRKIMNYVKAKKKKWGNEIITFSPFLAE